MMENNMLITNICWNCGHYYPTELYNINHIQLRFPCIKCGKEQLYVKQRGNRYHVDIRIDNATIAYNETPYVSAEMIDAALILLKIHRVYMQLIPSIHIQIIFNAGFNQVQIVLRAKDIKASYPVCFEFLPIEKLDIYLPDIYRNLVKSISHWKYL
jgi:hypothetical protein